MSSVHYLSADPRDSARLAYALNIRNMALGIDRNIGEPERTYIQELSGEFQQLFGDFTRMQPQGSRGGAPGTLPWFQEILNCLRQDNRSLPIFEGGDRIENMQAAMAYAMLRIRSSALYETNTKNEDRKNHIYMTGQGPLGNLHLADRREQYLQRDRVSSEAAEVAERYRQIYDNIQPDPDVERGFVAAGSGRERKLSFKDMVKEMKKYETEMKSDSRHIDSRLYRNIASALQKINENWDKDPAENIDGMLGIYEELGNACRTYLRERSGAITTLGKHRLSIVSNILRTQNQERLALEHYRDRLRQGDALQEGRRPTLLNIATEARTIQIPETTQRVGGNMSSRIRITEGKDQGFFTDDKHLGKSLKDDYLEQLYAEPGISKETKDNIADRLKGAELMEEMLYLRNGDEFEDFLNRHELINGETTPEQMGAWRRMIQDVDRYLVNRVPRFINYRDVSKLLEDHSDIPQRGMQTLARAFNGWAICSNLRNPPEVMGPEHNILRYVKEGPNSEADKEAGLRFQERYSKRVMSESTSQAVAGIPSESLSRLNDRAIATSIMAGLLGCPDLVVQAQKAQSGTGAAVRNGMFMETAEGTGGYKLSDIREADGWKNPGAPPDVKRQLADLQILDLICGQCDRHADNIMWETDKQNRPIAIKGIDQDMSFGVYDVETCGSNSSHLGLTRVVDQKTYEFVENLAKPENRALIEYKFRDLLSEREIDALCGRIDTVAQWLRQDKVKKVQPEEWSALSWKDLILKAPHIETNVYPSSVTVRPDNIFSRAASVILPAGQYPIFPTQNAQQLYDEGIEFERNVLRQRDLQRQAQRQAARNARQAANPAAQNQQTLNPAAQGQPQAQNPATQGQPQAQNPVGTPSVTRNPSSGGPAVRSQPARGFRK